MRESSETTGDFSTGLGCAFTAAGAGEGLVSCFTGAEDEGLDSTFSSFLVGGGRILFGNWNVHRVKRIL